MTDIFILHPYNIQTLHSCPSKYIFVLDLEHNHQNLIVSVSTYVFRNFHLILSQILRFRFADGGLTFSSFRFK